MNHISQKTSSIAAKIPSNVELIAITKQVGVEAMRMAYASGIRNFGENRLQEALSKQEQLQDLSDVSWHFIGHIQKNKAKKVIENFDWIHSVDSLSLAERLNRIAGELKSTPKVLLQVKVLPDPNKYGWEKADLLQDLSQLAQLQYLDFQGLMTILPWGLSESEALEAFKATQKLARQIQHQNYPNLIMKELSMGMSGDYMQAIAAGATQIRLGRIIFGERN